MEDWQFVAAGIASLTIAVYWFSSRRANAPLKQVPNAPSPTASSASDQTANSPASGRPKLPRVAFEEDEGVDATMMGILETGWLSPPTAKIIYDEDAAIDEPTQASALIAITAVGQTDKGRRRRTNEDCVLIREAEGLFVVADGMGGYRGGELASNLAIQTIDEAFKTHTFKGDAHPTIPKRASELARAIQMANYAILRKATEDKRLEGMGTTICAARFSMNKQRLYIGHVGDSRIYCLRNGTLQQMTSDHTMRDLGVEGDGAAYLSRAVGIWPTVPVDIILGKPRPGDLYMLCSDGLTKMVNNDQIERVLKDASPQSAVEQLISVANEHGGNDNITIVVIRIDDPLLLRPHAA